MDVTRIREDFVILKRKVGGKPLVYLDNAATTQKPAQVIEAMVEYYQKHNANVHRGIHTLGDESTRMYEAAREKVAEFVGAKPNELIFVRNATEAINLVAYAWARESLGEGDLILTSEQEHHSNLVPWQEVAKATGAGLVYVTVDEAGRVDMVELAELLEQLGTRVKLVALSAVSNVTGAELPVEKLMARVKKLKHKVRVLIDGAQMVGHKKTDLGQLGVDFWAFSGHKMYGPMGIGGLVVKGEVLERMEPFLTGGGMIGEVYLTGSTWAELPDRFDAGTPNVAGAVGLAAACKYLADLGMKEVEEHDRELVEYALEKLEKQKKVKLIGPREKRLGSVAFIYEGVHGHDVAQVLDSEGVAVRSGHHCAMPLHEKFGWGATIRASFGVYNTGEEIDRLAEGLEKVRRVFSK